MEQMHIILKRLRKQAGLSQEALAELLGISGAAISKWENAITVPDMSQIVSLTNIFGVSADELFGIRGQNEDEEIHNILDELYKLEDVYPPEDGMRIIEEYRAALKDHPKNISLLSEALAFFAMFLLNYDVLNEQEQKEVIKDCVRFADLIMRYSDSEEKIISAKRSLIDIYCKQNEYDSAIEVAKSLPTSISNTRDIVLSDVFWKAGRFDDEKDMHISNIEKLMFALQTQVIMLANRYKDEENYEDALFCYNFANNMLDIAYGEQKYRPPYIRRGISYFGYPAECLLKLGRDEEALDMLESFTEHYIAERKEFNKTLSLDNPIMRGQIYSFGYGGKAKFNEYYQSVLGMPCFERLINHPRFIKITETLTEGILKM